MDTKKYLLNAFYDLLQVQSFKKITVEMILEKSGVSRSTFYRSFRDKYDLMNQFYADFFVKTVNNSKGKSWKDATAEIVGFLHANRQFYVNAFKTEGANSCFDFLYTQSVSFVSRRYLEESGKPALTPTEKAAVYFYCAGQLQVVKRWVKGDFKCSPEEIAEILWTITPEILKEKLTLFVADDQGS